MHFRVRFSLLSVLAFISAGVAAGAPIDPGGSVEGDALFAAADFTGAAHAYRATLLHRRHDAAAERGLARIALYRNDLAEAERYAREVAADDPADPRAKRLLERIAERLDTNADYRVSLGAAEVDVPFTQVDPLPELDARIDGKSAHLLLDTGGEGLDLSATFSKRLGLVTHAGRIGTFAGGLHRAVRTSHAGRLDLGGASIRSIPVTVIDQLPPGIDGVLGTNVLYRFLSTIDYPHKRLVLRPKPASSAFEAAATGRGAIVVPMLLVPDHFIFARANVGKAPEALFSIDTGGGGVGVQLTKAELHAAGVVPDYARPATFAGGGGPARTVPFISDVTIGRRTIRRVPGVYFPDGDQFGIFPFAVAGTLSHELFKRGALTFDFVAMKLVFDLRRSDISDHFGGELSGIFSRRDDRDRRCRIESAQFFARKRENLGCVGEGAEVGDARAVDEVHVRQRPADVAEGRCFFEDVCKGAFETAGRR
jgi:hypothetical protein